MTSIMRKPRTSASSFSRTAACPGSAALPHIGEESGDAAAKGTVIHKFLEDCVNKGRDEALRIVPEEHFSACESINLSELPAGNAASYATEVAFAYNWRTGTARLLPDVQNRNYGALTDDEIPGTVDIVGLTEPAAIIWDYKTGRGHVDPAESNWQLKILGVAAAAAYGKDEAHVGIIRVWDKVNHFMSAHLDMFELEKAKKDIENVMLDAIKAVEDVDAGRVPQLNIGLQCEYCPCMRVCPAVTGFLQSSRADPNSLIFNPIELSPEEAGQAYLHIKVLKKVVKIMEDNLKEIAKVTPLPLGNGMVLAEVLVPRESPDSPGDAPIVKSVMTRLYGKDAGEESVEIKMSSSKTLVEKIVRKYMSPGDPIGKTVDAALDAIREAGGMSERPTYSVRPVAVKSIKTLDDGESWALPPRE